MDCVGPLESNLSVLKDRSNQATHQWPLLLPSASADARYSDDVIAFEGMSGVPRNMTGVAEVMSAAGYRTHFAGYARSAATHTCNHVMQQQQPPLQQTLRCLQAAPCFSGAVVAISVAVTSALLRSFSPFALPDSSGSPSLPFWFWFNSKWDCGMATPRHTPRGRVRNLRVVRARVCCACLCACVVSVFVCFA